MTRALAAGNAWWRDPGWERKDRDLRALAAITLAYDPSPLSDVVPDGLYVLRGPRRVGKSLEIKRAISRTAAGCVRLQPARHRGSTGAPAPSYCARLNGCWIYASMA